MKQAFPVFLLLLPWVGLNGQFLGIPDTILSQPFTVDPSDTMLVFPTGNDLQWVNWDADNLPTLCGDPQPVPGAWYWESDLGGLSNPPVNFAFTSCSFLTNSNQPNENWLITPPVFIPDSTTVLHWRSMAFEGPGYMDGYKVLISTSTNEPFTGAFTDTIFVAAEMLDFLQPGSLDPDDYIFSPGYVHANGYTDTAYFFLITPNAGAYTGRLEPHWVSLAAYAGQSVYIAFLHDSTDDSVLQLDDITVVHGFTSSTPIAGAAEYFLQISPNPATETARITWQFPARENGRLLLTNLFGEKLMEEPVEDLNSGIFLLKTGHLPAGLYPCTLQTASGRQTVMLVKQ